MSRSRRPEPAARAFVFASGGRAAAALSVLLVACTMPNPAFHESLTDSGASSQSGSHSGSSGDAGTTAGGPDTNSSDASASVSASATEGTGTGDASTGEDVTSGPSTTNPMTVSATDPTSDTADSETATTGAPLAPPMCEEFADDGPPRFDMHLDGVGIQECGNTVTWTGWYAPLADLDPGVSGFEFHDLDCGDGVKEATKDLAFTGRFPQGFEPVYDNDFNQPNTVWCVTFEITWSAPLNGECEIAAAVLWRHFQDEMDRPREPTPLWAATRNKLEFAGHSLQPLAPLEWAPIEGSCTCAPDGQECCDTIDNSSLVSGFQKAYSQQNWDMSEVPFGEGEQREGCSGWQKGNLWLYSDYTLRLHRARVEPLCELPRDDLEWVVERQFIGGGGFSCA